MNSIKVYVDVVVSFRSDGMMLPRINTVLKYDFLNRIFVNSLNLSDSCLKSSFLVDLSAFEIEENIETPIIKTPRDKNTIPGSFATPEAVSHIMTQKFVMGAPLYRQEQELNRQGIQLSQ